MSDNSRFLIDRNKLFSKFQILRESEIKLTFVRGLSFDIQIDNLYAKA